MAKCRTASLASMTSPKGAKASRVRDSIFSVYAFVILDYFASNPNFVIPAKAGIHLTAQAGLSPREILNKFKFKNLFTTKTPSSQRSTKKTSIPKHFFLVNLGVLCVLVVKGFNFLT